MSDLAKAADYEPNPHPPGYLAQYPEAFPSVIRVWAPCGCILTSKPGVSLLSQCGAEACNFSYWEAQDAIEALISANLGAKPLEVSNETNTVGSSGSGAGPELVAAEPDPNAPAGEPEPLPAS